MDLKFIRDNISKKITFIKSSDDIVKWVNDNNLTITNSNKAEILKKYNEYFKLELEKRIDDVIKVIGVYSFNFETPETNISNSTDNYGKNGAIIGGLGGAGLILLLEGALGPVGWLAAGATALFGYFLGQSKVHDKVVQEIYNSSINAQNKITSELEKLIDSIIAKENISDDFPSETASDLSKEQFEIKQFIESRGIKYLVHFTNVKNLESIKKYGLLSRNKMNSMGIVYYSNDLKRNDKYLDGICLSITHINENLYNKFRYNNELANYTVIKINPAILWLNSNRRIYCQTNAATQNGAKGEKIDNLKAMFADYVSYTNSSGHHEYNRKYSADNETTDTQAEVLWFDNVPKEYLIFNE